MKRLLPIVCCGFMLALSLFASAKREDEPKDKPKGAPAPPAALGAIHPRISPDGATIAVSYQGAIWTVPAHGDGVMTRLTDGEGFDHEPAWSPDGKTIAFVRGPNQLGGDLRLIQAKDGKDVPLPKPVNVRGTYNFHKLEFSPDGNRLLGVYRADGKDVGLAWYDLKTGAVKSLDAPPLTYSGRYALSPEGKWVAYTTTMDKTGEQAGNNGPQADVWIVSAEGGKAEKLVQFPSRVFDLCFHPNGANLIVVSDLGGAYNDIWQIPLEAGPSPRARLAGLKKLTAGQADEDRPSLSRDGKRLIYSDNRAGATTLVVRDLTTGKEHTVQPRRLDYRTPTGTLRLQTKDQGGKKSVTARVALRQDKGKFYAPPGALYRMLRGAGHFYCDKTEELVLPAGAYRLRATRGPEYKPAFHDITIQPGKTLELTVELERWTHAAKDGWYSGENHIHANYGYGQWYNTPETMFAQCAGEDLSVCNLVVANSDTDGIFDRPFFRGGPDPLSTPETILYWNQEFRSTLWGHMTLVNLRQVVEPVMTGFHATTNPWDIPTNSDMADRAHWQKGHVNYTHAVQDPVKPFDNPYAAKGLPIDVALGKIDSLDLNNAYAGTVPVWYRLLNCGFRLPPSAGTDCFLNRIFSQLPGGDRVYVHVPGGLTYAAWIDNLKKGRSFVSNGPMLEFTLDGKGLGESVKLAGPRKLRVKASARSLYKLAKVELIYNGKIAVTLPLAKYDRSATLDEEIDVKHSGWLALRASGPGHEDSVVPAVYAHTAPIYLDIAGSSGLSRDDALFFLKWIDELSPMVRLRDRIPDAALREHVENQLDAARRVYAKVAKEGS
ncbi:MAG: CehA/McbA family metallohydrolase [Gemmataceae bacterium]